MTEEEIRAAALDCAVLWFKDCSGPDGDYVPRQVIVDTAMRFEEYIKTGR